jgi:predicted esterase
MAVAAILSDEADARGSEAALVSVASAGRSGADFPVVIALHARGRDASTDVDRVRGLFGDGPDVVALQAARPCNPMQSNLQSVAAYAGFSWYLGDDPAHPEAASFGDALAQIDGFTSRIEQPFVIAGNEQGAVLALTLALYAPPRLVGVHSAGGSVAIIPGWEPPELRLDGLDVLDEDGRLEAPGPSHRLSRLGARIASCGASTDERRAWLQSLLAYGSVRRA